MSLDLLSAALIVLAGSLSSLDDVRPAPTELVAASFNIRYGTASDGPDRWHLRRQRCIEAIRACDADILGLQEALRFQVNEIADALPEHVWVGVGRDDGADGGEFAPIFVSRGKFEIIEHGTFWLSDTPEQPGSRSWGNDLPRICTWVRLATTMQTRPGGPDGPAGVDAPDGPPDATPTGVRDAPRTLLRVFNTHLDHRSQASRERSAAAIRAAIEAVPREELVLVLGDLNAGPENPAFTTLLHGARAGALRPEDEGDGAARAGAPAATGESAPPADAPTAVRSDVPAAPASAAAPGPPRSSDRPLHDAWRVANPEAPERGTAHGFRGEPTTGRIDVIFVDPRLTVLSATIDQAKRDGRFPSDHFAVIARLSLPARLSAP
ncbi:MAG TPA: endonuclease/exonuclease/phosphatase family protein [Phycisphaerales bacterium]|nr:endonuclease/exonuclease/phosphatase family protein [Phycisphaerales bacterium]HMP36356.1 endonuclease/exonuclease/phosphatase family protein [Phycisphaerales bacterium]